MMRPNVSDIGTTSVQEGFADFLDNVTFWNWTISDRCQTALLTPQFLGVLEWWASVWLRAYMRGERG